MAEARVWPAPAAKARLAAAELAENLPLPRFYRGCRCPRRITSKAELRRTTPVNDVRSRYNSTNSVKGLLWRPGLCVWLCTVSTPTQGINERYDSRDIARESENPICRGILAFLRSVFHLWISRTSLSDCLATCAVHHLRRQHRVGDGDRDRFHAWTRSWQSRRRVAFQSRRESVDQILRQ